MVNNDWLDQVQEEIIDPDRALCDPHHHLWDHRGSRYLLDELRSDMDSGHRVDKTVFVECNAMYRADSARELAPVGETEFVQGIAAMSASGGYGKTRIAAGIVSFADLTLGEAVRDVLEAHVAASPNRFRGIRHAAGYFDGPEIRNSHTNPPAGLMEHDNFRQGLAVLGDMGLTFDAWFYHYQLDDFAKLANDFPGVTIVLDHFGGPLGIGPFDRNQTFDDWRQSIDKLVNCDNVYFKLGGINMKINGFNWHKGDKPPTSDELVAASGRYYHHCISTFGAARCMFESNFPVDRESCSYPVLWNAFKKMASEYSAAEQDALLHDTATRVYRL